MRARGKDACVRVCWRWSLWLFRKEQEPADNLPQQMRDKMRRGEGRRRGGGGGEEMAEGGRGQPSLPPLGH